MIPRQPPSSFPGGSPPLADLFEQKQKLEDVLGAELEKKKKIGQIKAKYGLPTKPQSLPPTQWMGDPNS